MCPRVSDTKPEDESWSIPSLREPRYSQSLERGLAILGCFTPERPVLGIADISDDLGMSRSTTHRYAITLVALGFLEQGANLKKFAVIYEARGRDQTAMLKSILDAMDKAGERLANTDRDTIGELQRVPKAALQAELGELTGLPIHLWDERLTTHEAHQILYEAGHARQEHRRVVDQVAATLILQLFLDARAAAS